MTAQLRLIPRPDQQRRGAGSLLGNAVMYPVDSATPLTCLAEDDLRAHTVRFGSRPSAFGSDARELIETLDVIALSGPGDSRRPLATDWRAHLAAGGGGIVVANGAESEPASAKDTALMQLRPHLILDGIACAAEAVGARDAVVWLRGSTHPARAAMMRAVAQRRTAGLREPPIRVVVGPDRYLSGEAGAIVNALSGGPTLPQFSAQPIAVSGVHGRPTLVHDVETFARIALAARTGPDGYRATTLLTVADDTARTVVEVAPHTPIGQAIETVAACYDEQAPQAVLVGGFRGTWLRWDDVADLPADADHLHAQGIALSAGVLMPLSHDACGIAVVAQIARYLAASSARQCGPCAFGLRELAEVIANLADSRAARSDLDRAGRYLDEITGRGACAHPDGATHMIESALAAFADDVHAHHRHGRCRHRGVARSFPIPDLR
jgi:NADH:ubiquinone oxidoreductase subunit F (NADH-binding)